MGKVAVLDPLVAQQVAAGEVVDDVSDFPCGLAEQHREVVECN